MASWKFILHTLTWTVESLTHNFHTSKIPISYCHTAWITSWNFNLWGPLNCSLCPVHLPYASSCLCLFVSLSKLGPDRLMHSLMSFSSPVTFLLTPIIIIVQCMGLLADIQYSEGSLLCWVCGVVFIVCFPHCLLFMYAHYLSVIFCIFKYWYICLQ